MIHPRAESHCRPKTTTYHGALSSEGLLERLFEKLFNGLVYTQIWEDPEIDLEALSLTPECHVVAIASGGCNVLSYLTADPARITALDLSRAHVALNRLKLVAAGRVDAWETFYRFFGAADSEANIIFGAVIVAGLLGFLAAPFFSKAVRFFPPVVTGTVITLIGVSLLPVAFGWAQGSSPSAGDFGSATNLSLAGATLVIVLLLRRFTRGFVKQIAVLLGLVAGTLIAIPFGVTDFSPVAEANIVGFPTPFHFGAPQFQVAAIVSLCVVMVVSMTESTADMLALGEIVDRPADEKTIAAGLRADTLGSAISPLFNGFMCSAFAQNIGLVAMTKIRSRYVVATGGGFLILMGLCPMAASLIAVVPRPVLGGAGVVLFGSVARRQARATSDIDLVVVAEELPRRLADRPPVGVGPFPEIAPHVGGRAGRQDLALRLEEGLEPSPHVGDDRHAARGGLEQPDRIFIRVQRSRAGARVEQVLGRSTVRACACEVMTEGRRGRGHRIRAESSLERCGSPRMQGGARRARRPRVRHLANPIVHEAHPPGAGVLEDLALAQGREGARDGLSGEYVRAVLEDRDGNLWIGGGGGLDRLGNDGGIEHIKVRGRSLDALSVLSIAQGPDGDVYLPALYPPELLPTDTAVADPLRLGRAPNGPKRRRCAASGQRVYMVGEEAVPVLQLATLDFE